MQRLHCLFGKQLRLSNNIVNQPFSQSKTLNTNYLSRNWFATQKDLLKEETPKEEPVFEVDVNSQTYKLLKVKQDYGNVNIKQQKSNYTVQEKIEGLATIDYIGKKLVWSPVYERDRKIGRVFEPNEIRPGAQEEYTDAPQPIKAKVSLKQTCYFCAELKEGAHPRLWDSMNLPLWRKFMNPYGAILGRRHTGTCSKHQRKVAKTVKRMIHMGLIGFKRGLQYDSPYLPPDHTYYIYDDPVDPNDKNVDIHEDEVNVLSPQDEIENEMALAFYDGVKRVPSNAQQWRESIAEEEEEEVDDEEEEELSEEEVFGVTDPAEERKIMKLAAVRKMKEYVDKMELAAEEGEEEETLKFVSARAAGLTAEDISGLVEKPLPRKMNAEKRKRREQKQREKR